MENVIWLKWVAVNCSLSINCTNSKQKKNEQKEHIIHIHIHKTLTTHIYQADTPRNHSICHDLVVLLELNARACFLDKIFIGEAKLSLDSYHAHFQYNFFCTHSHFFIRFHRFCCFFFLFISDSFSFNQLSFYFGRVFSFGTNFFVALFWLLMLESSVFLWFYMTWYVMMYDTHVARLTHNSIKNRSPTTTKIRAFLLIIYLYMDNVCNTRNFGQIKSSRKRQRKKKCITTSKVTKQEMIQRKSAHTHKHEF